MLNKRAGRPVRDLIEQVGLCVAIMVIVHSVSWCMGRDLGLGDTGVRGPQVGSPRVSDQITFSSESS